MRDKVGHDYPEIDIDLLWDTLVHGLPDVHRAIVNHQHSIEKRMPHHRGKYAG